MAARWLTMFILLVRVLFCQRYGISGSVFFQRPIFLEVWEIFYTGFDLSLCRYCITVGDFEKADKNRNDQAHGSENPSTPVAFDNSVAADDRFHFRHLVLKV